jgi:hypothetical protein
MRSRKSSQGRNHPDPGYSGSSVRWVSVAGRLLLLLWFAVTLVPARAYPLTEAARPYAVVARPQSARSQLLRAEQGDPAKPMDIARRPDPALRPRLAGLGRHLEA